MNGPVNPIKDLSGHKVGNYEVVTRLGKGGMGEVYLARHPVLGKEVAIKVLGGAVCQDEVLVQRFRQEAAAACRIGHPAIVDVADFGTMSDGRSYYVMELLRGQNLRQTLATRGPLGLNETQSIITPVMQAVAAAHHAGIIHRDIKPDNIFLAAARDGTTTPKILDFGVAKLLDVGGGSSAAMTRTGALIGTPLYMSPEQASGAGKKVGPWSDIYSVGAVLVHMLTGQPPFSGDSFGEVLVKHLQAPPPSVRQARPELPPALDAVIQRAMAKDPRARQPSMEALLQEFNAAVAGPTVPDVAPSQSPRAVQRAAESSGYTGPAAYAPTITPPWEAGATGPAQGSAPAASAPPPAASAPPPVAEVAAPPSAAEAAAPPSAAEAAAPPSASAPAPPPPPPPPPAVSTAAVPQRRPPSKKGVIIASLIGLLVGGIAVAAVYMLVTRSGKEKKKAGGPAKVAQAVYDATVPRAADGGPAKSTVPSMDSGSPSTDPSEVDASAAAGASVGPGRPRPSPRGRARRTRTRRRPGPYDDDSDFRAVKPARMTRLSFKIKSGLSKKHLLRAMREIRLGRYVLAFGFARSSYRIMPNAGAAEVAARAACLGGMRRNARWAYGKLGGARKRRVAAFCRVRGIDLR